MVEKKVSYLELSDRVNPCPAEWIKMPYSFLIFSQSDYLNQAVDKNLHTKWQTNVLNENSVDPDQLASEEANWSGSTLFAKAGHIWVQQD